MEVLWWLIAMVAVLTAVAAVALTARRRRRAGTVLASHAEAGDDDRSLR